MQAGGPIIASTGSGYTNYIGVGSKDTDYGKADNYYTKRYEYILPDSYPTKLYIYALSTETPHIRITQGDYVYAYNFPLGFYTSSELCSYFNNQLQQQNQSPLLLSYQESSDTFLIQVDDSYGSIKEPTKPDFSPSYLQEFVIDKSSLLLQRLGLISPESALSPSSLSDITSTGRRLKNNFPSYFRKTSGYAKGFYCSSLLIGSNNKGLLYS